MLANCLHGSFESRVHECRALAAHLRERRAVTPVYTQRRPSFISLTPSHCARWIVSPPCTTNHHACFCENVDQGRYDNGTRTMLAVGESQAGLETSAHPSQSMACRLQQAMPFLPLAPCLGEGQSTTWHTNFVSDSCYPTLVDKFGHMSLRAAMPWPRPIFLRNTAWTQQQPQSRI
jgi:hypothetical protein